MNYPKNFNFLSWFKAGAKDFFDYVAIVINFIILTMVYLMGVLPTFIIAKIFNKKFLETDTRKNQESYWEDFKQDFKQDKNNNFKQF